MSNEEKLKVIRKHWGKLSYDEIGKMTGQKANAVRCMGRRAGLPAGRVTVANPLTPEQEIARDSRLENLDSKAKSSDAKYRLIKEDLKNAQAMLEAFKCVGNESSYTIKSSKGDDESLVTAVAVASDWHWAESVHSENVNGKNEFTLEIAKQRAEKFFVSIVRLVKIFKKESRIENMILALLGDFINGQLREEAMENNSLRPMEEMLEVWKVLSGGIQYILDNTDLALTLPCHSGNHARTTKKIHVSTESGNSLEYVLYHILASDFKDNKRVKFIIPTSYHSFIDVGGVKVRFHHGHSMKYGGGVGGIFIPVKKAIGQWNKTEWADLDVFGHFHQMRDGGDFLCNGSLIGYNEFAIFIKADFEKPKQTFFLIDHKRKERTVTAPVFLT